MPAGGIISPPLLEPFYVHAVPSLSQEPGIWDRDGFGLAGTGKPKGRADLVPLPSLLHRPGTHAGAGQRFAEVPNVWLRCLMGRAA